MFSVRLDTMDRLLFKLDLVGLDMLDTWEMLLVRLLGTAPTIASNLLGRGLLALLFIRENTIGAASFTSLGSLLCQNKGNRSLL